MDNRQRAINYVRQNYGHDQKLSAQIVDHAMDRSVYEKVHIYDLLTPKQLRRVKHKRGGPERRARVSEMEAVHEGQELRKRQR